VKTPIRIATSRENDGRWIAEALDFPGVLKYGVTREEARAKAESLAIELESERRWGIREVEWKATKQAN
jgi:predicted RNase H-like HicB family nuclease